MVFKNWQDVILLVIMLVVLFLGAPVVQLIKNALSAAVGKPVKDKWALLVTVVVAAGLALVEMWLSGMLKEVHLTVDNFPEFLTAVFSVATVYYKVFMATDKPVINV